ncbi:MAG: hypothetical protein ACD_79C00672G0002 [uncultured bacterium]|nr:MAG: hypothetical protein ACD_79C00672G0002 [uncultured bacterium]
MPECELIKDCPFFNDKIKMGPGVTEAIKNKYCIIDNSACARFMIYKAAGRSKVPFDLFPNNPEVAEKIIKENSKKV